MNDVGRMVEVAAILFFSLALLAGCESAKAFLSSPEGQAVAAQSLDLVDAIGDIIPIPGAGMVDEVLGAVLAMWLGIKTVRGGRNMLRNSEKGKILGSPMGDDK